MDQRNAGQSAGPFIRKLLELALAAELLEPWKDPGHLPAATEAVGRFLQDHTPS